MVGEFKDDQLEDHHHRIKDQNGNGIFTWSGTSGSGSGKLELNSGSSTVIAKEVIDGRKGVVTHGKQKGVKYIIKVL